MSILISVVIPTYRRPQLLSKCLKALLVSRFDKHRFEIIVVSDGPDPATQKIIDQYTGYYLPLLRYVAMPEKKGPAAARNYGWLNARGSIIAFTDDDCLPDVFWLSEIQKHCGAGEDVAIAGRVIVPLGSRPTDHEQNTANLQTAEFITANCACTRHALLIAGGFDEQFSMAWREDSDLEFKFINQEIPIRRVETAVVTHPVRQAPWGISIKEQKKTMFNALLFKKYPELYRQKIQPTPPVLYYAIILTFLMMLTGLLIDGHTIVMAGLATWLLFTAYFIFKRLQHKKMSPAHVSEMVITSLVIPFISIYWQWYGAVKYQVIFI